MSAAPRLPTPALVWFALLGAPTAWTLQHVTGFGLTVASCEEVGKTAWHISLDLWTIVASAITLGVGLAGVAASLLSLRRTRDAGTEPPGARLRFLALISATVAPLVLCIIVMSAAGVVLISDCVQS